MFRVFQPRWGFLSSGWLPLPEASASPNSSSGDSRPASISLRELWLLIARRRLLFLSILGTLLIACLLYCLIAPKEYEAKARVALRTGSPAPLGIGTSEVAASVSILSAPLQLETLANVFRSNQLAWKVIVGLRLYEKPGYKTAIDSRFSGFPADAPSADAQFVAAQDWLLDRFHQRLHVQTLPRTLLIEIRFRSHDPALSATVVNELIRLYGVQENESRLHATAEQTGSLEHQLGDLKSHMDSDRQKLAAFQNEHAILTSPESLSSGQTGETQHDSTLVEIEELDKQLVPATADRILREAEAKAASQGDPEVVFASSPRMQAESESTIALLDDLHKRKSELEEELAQLGIERGPNFPRVVEVRKQKDDVDKQIQTADAKLVQRFQQALQSAQQLEQTLTAKRDEMIAQALQRNQAATEYEVMRQEANSSHDVYLSVLGKVQEAGLVAGIQASSISVVDPALTPVKPTVPDPPLYMAIALFAGLWLALGGVLVAENIHPSGLGSSGPHSSASTIAALILAALVSASVATRAQAPTPNTSGLPGSALHPKSEPPPAITINPKTAPDVWDRPQAVNPDQTAALTLETMPGPIGPGDVIDITEFHTPEFHTVAHVSADGVVSLPLIHEIKLVGLDEAAAAQAIADELRAEGMLLHPQVSVLVTSWAGRDVSVLGEVARPGVYPFTLHHRLLDLLSAAQGLSPAAGRLVNIFHRDDAKTPHPVVLDPSGIDTASDHNPELAPGDTVQVSRAGLVYVIGDVVRPGGFPVDPAQGLTVVQALSLAWGPSLNANAGHALLIREQKGGRTLTTLNLRRMLHGQDPDQPIGDRDILFVPDSTAKTLLNKTVDAAIQSAVGVSIYAGLVYSQRF